MTSLLTNRLIRMATLAAAGSGLLDANWTTTNSETTLSASIFGPLIDLSSPQRPISTSPSLISLDCFQSGSFKLFLSRIGSISSDDEKKDASGEDCNGSKSISNAVAMVIPALVNISVPWRIDGKNSGYSAGSGTIIDSDGTILTCAHLVVGSRGKKVTSKGKVDVTLQDGRTFVGTVVNADLHSDIAVVKITPATLLPAAKLGSSHKLHLGDWVVAMGCPHSLQNTATAGIVSCVKRRSSEMGLGGMLREYIQIDCAINPGNSGGPLINLDGEVVGVNVMSVSSATGLNFAVPIDSVVKFMEHFRKNGRIVRPWLGLKMLDLNEAIISKLKDKVPMFPNVNRGVLVLMVIPGSPADLAGFHPGDVVIEFQKKPVRSITEITELTEERIGVPMNVVVKRAKDISKVLTVIPEEATPEF